MRNANFEASQSHVEKDIQKGLMFDTTDLDVVGKKPLDLIDEYEYLDKVAWILFLFPISRVRPTDLLAADRLGLGPSFSTATMVPLVMVDGWHGSQLP